MEPMPLSFPGLIHYSAAEGPARDPLRAVRPVRDGRRRRSAARLLADRAEHASPGTATTTRRRGARWHRRRRPGARPAVVDACRRGVPGAHLRRLPRQHLRDRLERLEHHPADRLGRTGRNLRPRAARTSPSTRPGRTGRRAGLHVRPLRLPRSRDHRVPVGPARRGVQRRVPPHLADRHPAQGWNLGDALTQRDASARTFDDLFTLDEPRDPRPG